MKIIRFGGFLISLWIHFKIFITDFFDYTNVYLLILSLNEDHFHLKVFSCKISFPFLDKSINLNITNIFCHYLFLKGFTNHVL